MKERRRETLGGDALFQYIGVGAQLFTGMFFYIVIAHLFSTDVVGIVSLLIAIVGLFNMIFSFGLGTASQHFLSYYMGLDDQVHTKSVTKRILIIGIFLSILGLMILFALSPVISVVFLHSTSFVSLVRILSLVLFGNILYTILNGMLLGLQRFKVAALMNFIMWSTYYMSAILFSVFFHSLVSMELGWILGVTIGTVLELFLVTISIKTFSSRKERTKKDKIFRYALPVFLASSMGYSASYADRFIVAGLMNLSQLGIYNFALLVASTIGIIAFPFNNMLLPKFSELFGRGDFNSIKIISSISTRLLTSIFAPISLGVVALSNIVLQFLSGSNSYSYGIIPLDIIVLGVSVFVELNVITQVLAATKNTRFFIISSSLSLFLNIILSIILVPVLGMTGAAIGFVSVYALTFFVLRYFAGKSWSLKYDRFPTIKIWVSSLVMFLVMQLIIMFTSGNADLLPLYILVGAVIYLFVFKLLKIFSKKDQNILLTILKDNPLLSRIIVKIIA